MIHGVTTAFAFSSSIKWMKLAFVLKFTKYYFLCNFCICENDSCLKYYISLHFAKIDQFYSIFYYWTVTFAETGYFFFGLFRLNSRIWIFFSAFLDLKKVWIKWSTMNIQNLHYDNTFFGILTESLRKNELMINNRFILRTRLIA